MKKQIITTISAIAVALSFSPRSMAHCEIPCGIYNDQLRIVSILEDCTTIEKSMNQIIALHDKDDFAALDVNQIVRWVNNKEEHANKIQHAVTQYFLTQRIKMPADPTEEAMEKYTQQLIHLHQMLVHAMKAKQTVDTAHVEKLRELTKGFSKLYFSPEDLEHLMHHHGEE